MCMIRILSAQVPLIFTRCNDRFYSTGGSVLNLKGRSNFLYTVTIHTKLAILRCLGPGE